MYEGNWWIDDHSMKVSIISCDIVEWQQKTSEIHLFAGVLFLEKTITDLLDSDETSSSATLLTYFHIVYQSFFSIEHFFLYFSSYFVTYRLNFAVFWPVWALRSLECSVSYPSSCFEVSAFCKIISNQKQFTDALTVTKKKRRVDENYQFQCLYSRKIVETIRT